MIESRCSAGRVGAGNDERNATDVPGGGRSAGGEETRGDRIEGHVLLVEDERADRLIFRHMLENIGVDHRNIVIVDSAALALSEALEHEPDFVVCDWQLGEGSAQSLLRDLRSVCSRAATVVISANVDETREALALEAGAQEVLAKADTSPERLHQALRRARERQRAANRERDLAVRIASANRLEQMGTLAAGAIHDLNNLLASASINLEVLRSPSMLEGLDLGPEALMRDMGLALERAGRLCHQLLAYGKQGPSEPAPYDLRPLTDGCVNILPRRLRSRVNFDLHPGDPPPPAAVVDPSTFEQVAYNLLLNAGDAVGESGRVEVDVVPDARGYFGDHHVVVPRPPGVGMVVLRVRDDGPGIEPSRLRSVFKPFVSSKRGSRGLGLPSVVRAIRISGGALSLKTGPEGTTFFAGFPVEAGHGAAVVDETSSRKDVASQFGPVLVVDHRAPSPAVQRLRDDGHAVEWCRSDEGCMHLLDDLRGRVSVVVVHVSTTVEDTMDLVADLWAAHPDLPMVILDDREFAQQSLDTAVHAGIVRDLDGLAEKIAMLAPLRDLH